MSRDNGYQLSESEERNVISVKIADLIIDKPFFADLNAHQDSERSHPPIFLARAYANFQPTNKNGAKDAMARSRMNNRLLKTTKYKCLFR